MLKKFRSTCHASSAFNASSDLDCSLAPSESDGEFWLEMLKKFSSTFHASSAFNASSDSDSSLATSESEGEDISDDHVNVGKPQHFEVPSKRTNKPSSADLSQLVSHSVSLGAAAVLDVMESHQEDLPAKSFSRTSMWGHIEEQDRFSLGFHT